MRILDLFCGAGGAGVGYDMAGFDDIVGVDIKDQPNYPFTFVKGDAVEYLRENGHRFDLIHASPPCQAYSMMQNIHHNRERHPELIDEVRDILVYPSIHTDYAYLTPTHYIIENVPKAPLINPITLCGTMFGLPIIRHRIFEASFDIGGLLPPCNHSNVYDPWHGGEMARGERVKLAQAMGIRHQMTRTEVRQAIPPVFTKYLGEKFLGRCQ